MAPGRQEAIRTLAYHIWEAEGRPDGRALEHWVSASRQLSAPTRIDALSSAGSVLELLSRVDMQKFPPEERMALSTVQVEALDDWLSAYWAKPDRDRASSA